jgi:hypothetical protein
MNSRQAKYSTEKTHGGGNCAFDAARRAIFNEDILNQIEKQLTLDKINPDVKFQEFIKQAGAALNIADPNWETVKAAILRLRKSPNPDIQLEYKLNQVLRNIAMLKAEKELDARGNELEEGEVFEDIEYERTLDILNSAYDNYVSKRIRETNNSQDTQTNTKPSARDADDADDIFSDHKHIQDQFERLFNEHSEQHEQDMIGSQNDNDTDNNADATESSALESKEEVNSEPKQKQQQLQEKSQEDAEKKLHKWWHDTGYPKFIEDMKKDGKYAGDLELARLAAYFGVNLCEVSRDYYPHYECGEIPLDDIEILSDKQIQQLVYFGIIDSKIMTDDHNQISTPLKFLPLSAQDVEEKLQDIPSAEMIYRFIHAQIKSGKLSRDVEVPKTWSEKCTTSLLQRGIIKLNENGKYTFVEFKLEGKDADEFWDRFDSVDNNTDEWGLKKTDILQLWKNHYKHTPTIYLKNKNKSRHWQNAIVEQKSAQQVFDSDSDKDFDSDLDEELSSSTFYPKQSPDLANEVIELNNFLSQKINQLIERGLNNTIEKDFIVDISDFCDTLTLAKNRKELKQPLQTLKSKLNEFISNFNNTSYTPTTEEILRLKDALQNAQNASNKITQTSSEFASAKRNALNFEIKAKMLSSDAKTKMGQASTTDAQLKLLIKESKKLIDQAEITESMLRKTIDSNKQSYFSFFNESDLSLQQKISSIRKACEIFHATINDINAHLAIDPENRKLNYYGDSLKPESFKAISAGTQEDVERKALKMLNALPGAVNNNAINNNPVNNNAAVAVIRQQDASDTKKIDKLNYDASNKTATTRSTTPANNNMHMYVSTYQTIKKDQSGKRVPSTTSLVTAEGKLDGKYQAQIFGDRNALEKEMPNAEIVRLAQERVKALRNILPDQKAKLEITTNTPAKLAFAIIAICELNKHKGYVVPHWKPLTSYVAKTDPTFIALRNEMKIAAKHYMDSETRAYGVVDSDSAEEAMDNVKDKSYSSFLSETVDKVLGLDPEQHSKSNRPRTRK